jgi:CheY-like chemotaxis protein
VDDHTTFREALSTDLQAFENIEIVGQASNGEDGVVSAATLLPTVVVMDINMPKIDGITATRLIKAMNPEIVVVGLSADSKNYQLYAMQKAGALKILSKGTPVTELYRAIQESVAAVRPVLVLEPAEGVDRLDDDRSVMSNEAKSQRPTTLGDVLYANSTALVPEEDWVTLVQSIADGDQLALHALYDRTHCPVFTLIIRLTGGNREIAEQLTIDVFHDVWRRASNYDAGKGTCWGGL